ncbi:MAG TPA: SUMF1/EgtB/PvdO family nonheme iron enzyme [Byssovorax sp.]
MREQVVFALVVAGALVGAAALLAPKLAAPPAPVDAPTTRGVDDEAPPPAPSSSASAPPAVSASAPPLPRYVRPIEGALEACGEGMVLVDGVSCPFVGHTCATPRAGDAEVCEAYGPDVLCEGRLVHRRFCVDRDEYPNLEGALPAVRVDFDEASRGCSNEGKRLCTVEEWQFACEGAAMWPYPTGRVRDARACNLDVAPGAALSTTSDAQDPPALDGRTAAGERPACVSVFGARDLSGNVAEWTVNEAGKVHTPPFRSAIVGGSWASPRAACRAVKTDEAPAHRALDLGFRCCKDARGTPRSAEPSTAPKPPKRRRIVDAPP